MRARVLVQALAAAALLSATANAQITPQVRPQRPAFATPEQTLQVTAGLETGPLVARYYLNRSGYVAGTIFGDRIAGYHYVSGGQNKLAFIRYRGSAPVQVFTADATPSGWSGLAHGLAAPFASPQSNAVGFVSLPVLARVQRICPIWAPCPPPDPPPLPPPPAVGAPALWVDAAAAFSIVVGQSHGALLLRDDAARNLQGAFEGRVFSDRIVGHYASAGHIAFVRYTGANAPYQVWRGLLDGNGIKGGNVYPLAPQGDATPQNDPPQDLAPFDWSIFSLDQALVGVRSTGAPAGNRCLNEGPAVGGSCAHQWVLHASGDQFSGPGGQLFSFIHANNGLCLHLSGTANDPATQAPCDGSDNQALILVNVIYSVDGDPIDWDRVETVADFNASSNLVINRLNSMQCMSVRSDLVIVSGDCESNRANWARQP